MTDHVKGRIGERAPVKAVLIAGIRDGVLHPYTVDASGGIPIVPAEEPAILFATGTAAGSGDNTIVAAPGSGKRLRITAIQIQNESAVATTAILKFGATAVWRVLGQEQGNGVSIPLAPGYSWPVGANAALVLNLSGANSHGYSVAYYVEDV